jgi:hypothetical protein
MSLYTMLLYVRTTNIATFISATFKLLGIVIRLPVNNQDHINKINDLSALKNGS